MSKIQILSYRGLIKIELRFGEFYYEAKKHAVLIEGGRARARLEFRLGLDDF